MLLTRAAQLKLDSIGSKHIINKRPRISFEMFLFQFYLSLHSTNAYTFGCKIEVTTHWNRENNGFKGDISNSLISKVRRLRLYVKFLYKF